MKTFPARIIYEALSTIGHGPHVVKSNYSDTHRPGFAILVDTSFAIVVAEIANTIVHQEDDGRETSHTYLMSQLVDLVDEMREAPSGYHFPGWELREQD